MERIAIMADSGCDLPEEMINKENVRVLPLKILYEDGEYLDGVNIEPSMVYDRFPGQIPKTSTPNFAEVIAAAEELKAKGYNRILAVCISSGLSSTWQNVCAALSEVEDIEFHAVDSKNISIGAGVLAMYAQQLVEQGLPFEEICRRVEENVESSHIFYYMDTLDYLRAGGRTVGIVAKVNALKPDLVIPFKLDKKAAKAGLMKHLAGKRLLPKIFKEQNHIDEIKGIYVPFWLFDTDVDAQIRYRATRVRTWSDKDYNYTETSHFMVHRGGSIGFEHVPVDGSSKMADDLMESIEPYDFSEAMDFQTAYLAGYLADKYDVTAEASIDRANKRVKRSTEDTFAGTVQGYTSVTTENSSVQFRGGKARYALYPVWLLNTTWNGNKYTFAMNGQTGKFVGDLPVDKAAATRWTFLLAAIYGVAAYGVAWLLHLIGLF